MTISNKGLGRKTDKETQSPLLKIFKEIMKRENNDPEKTNLLKEMQEDRKKKQHSISKTKSHNKIRDSSSSEKRKNVPFKTNVEQRNVDQVDQYQCREPRSTSDDNPKADEDTCSCVSCALKKCSSENMCICVYVIMFVLTAMLALYLVFKNMPSLNVDVTEKPSLILDSERLKRKIEMFKDGMNHRYGDGDVKFKGGDERILWDDSLSNHFDGLSGLSDFGSSNLRELVSPTSIICYKRELHIEQHDSLKERNKLPSDLSSVVFNDKLIDDDNSYRLRNFYKKLIQTDERIKNLKKGLTNYNINTNTEFDFNLADRAKRSVFIRRAKKHPIAKMKKDIIDKSNKEALDAIKLNTHYPHLYLLNLNTPKTEDISESFKRYENFTRDPLGFSIEEKQLLVHYSPNVEGNKKVPKCSHTPKESKSHEHQLKHPFYKNSQRLDEFLDRFIHVPRILNQTFKTDDLFQYNKSPCKHPKIIKDSNNVAKGDTNSDKNYVSKNTLKSKDAYLNKKELDSDDEATDSYRVAMSISTLLNSDRKPATPLSNQKDPRLRKLMQLDKKEDENCGYEDINEVLDEDTGTHDDNDKEVDRKKRMDETFPTSNQLLNNPNNHNPLGVYNPNWKGPMPLYPDELNSMINQAVLNFNKIQETLNKDGLRQTIEGENELSDTEYVENYLSSKNDRLVKMAQAYSDYGVLEAKKETRGEDTTRTYFVLEKTVKMSLDKRNSKGGLLGRWKKNSPSQLSQHEFLEPATEGIRFALRPTLGSREDNPKDVFEMIRKHVKITHSHGYDKPKIHPLVAPPSIDTDASLKLLVNDEAEKYITSTTTEDNNFKSIFSKGKRSLQSIDLIDDFESRNNNAEDDEIDDDKPNIEDTKVKHFATNFGMETNNESIILIKRELRQSENNDIDANKSLINVSKYITVTKNNSNLKENDMNMVFSDFFGLLAKCFGALDGVYMDTNKQKSNYSSSKTDDKEINTTKNKSSEIMYPVYDSDMIDNIGHRSRALMSIEDKSNVTFEQNSEMADVIIDGKKSTDIVNIKTDTNTKSAFNYTTKPVKIKYPMKTTTHKNAITNKVEKKGDKTKNKTIVKRNAEDSNLIFWNDIYDEEYGIQLDPLENTVKEKYPVMTYNNVMQNSKLWLRAKIKKLKDNMFKSTQKIVTNKPTKKRPGRSINRLGAAIHQNGYNLKRDTNIPSSKMNDDDLDKGLNFAELTKNMKKVCKEAARAVQKTRNVEVREETKDESVATSLMQQLVYLMTDLVDYQVQQKTCVNLPSDLSTFLVWLTSPNQVASGPFKLSHSVNDAVDILSTSGSDDLPEPIMPSSGEKEETHPESRSECLSTLQAVQELMQEFDAMSDEDKSKMTGVREYLLNQSEYLNQQLYFDVDENNDPQKRYNPIRCKRLANTNHINKMKRPRAKRKLHKFIKNFGKKHTRSTASFYESIQETECKSEIKNGVRIDSSNGKPKRNLKDVYYKAVSDAKIATVKTAHKKDDKKENDE